MGKLDKLRQSGLGNAAESMGAGAPGRNAPGSPLHGATAVGPPAVPAQLQGVARNKDAALIPTDKIGPDPDQPREEFDPDELKSLTESLRTRGQLQPITVSWDEGRGLYVIVCGERRWRAARLAGMTTMAATILSRAPEPGERLALQLIENLLRADLRPVEQAKAYRQLMGLHGWTAAQLARELAVTESKLTRALSLLELPAPVQEQVEQGVLAPATAYEISKIADRGEQEALATRVVRDKLTREETSRAVRDRRSEGAGGSPRATPHRAEFATANGRVTVSGPPGGVIAALEEALIQARASQGGPKDAAEAEAA
jgi:ParB family chromosome partitioning protein